MDLRAGSKCFTGTVGNVRSQLKVAPPLFLLTAYCPDIILAACDVEGNFLVVKVRRLAADS